jgi:hypothetical protein
VVHVSTVLALCRWRRGLEREAARVCANAGSRRGG